MNRLLLGGARLILSMFFLLSLTRTANAFDAIQTPDGGSTVGSYTQLADVLDKEIVPQAVEAILNTFPNAFGYLKECSTGVGLKLVNNSSSSSLASFTTGSANGRNENGKVTYDLKYSLTVNVAYLDFTDGNLTDNCREEIEHFVLHEMMRAFCAEALTTGILGGSTERFPMWFVEGMSQACSGGCYNGNDFVNKGLGITETTSEENIRNKITSSGNKLTGGTPNSRQATGYLAVMYIGQIASGKGLSAENITAPNIAIGLDRVLNKLIYGMSLDAVIIDVTGGEYESTSDFEAKFADSNSVSFISNLIKNVGTEGCGSIVGGDLTLTQLLPRGQKACSLFDLNTQTPNVVNRYPSDVVVMSGGTKTQDGEMPISTYTIVVPQEPEGDATAIEEISAELITTEYYTINGERLAVPQRGVTIEIKRYSDGLTIRRKHIVK